MEHAAHVRDARRVEAQRLVERRPLPRVGKEGMRCVGRGMRVGRREMRRTIAVHAACWRGLDREHVHAQGWAAIGGRAGGGAHVEHLEHARDAGGVEAQRLVERRRALPRVKRRACGEGRGMRGGSREAAGNRDAGSVQVRARLQIGGAGHGEERTKNMSLMSVTLEVSKLSGWLNADAP